MTWRAAWLAALLVVATAPPSAAVVLRYRYQAGEKLVYHDQLAMAVQSTAGGEQQARWQLRSNSRLRHEVREVDGGVYAVRLETLENETEHRVEGESPRTSEHLGKPERLRMDDRGHVLERTTEGEEEEAGDTGLTSPLDEFAILQQLFDQLIWPEGDVSPGATWTQTLKVDLTPDSKDVRTPVEVQVTSRFARLVQVREDTCAEIVSDFKIPLRTPQVAQDEGVTITIEGDIQGHLTSYFAVERGRSVVELATLGAVGRVTMRAEGGQSLTVRGLMKINTKTVLEENE